MCLNNTVCDDIIRFKIVDKVRNNQNCEVLLIQCINFTPIDIVIGNKRKPLQSQDILRS